MTSDANGGGTGGALTERLRRLHEVTEVPLPEGVAEEGTYVDLSQPITAVVDDLLRLLDGRGMLFHRAGQVGEVDGVTGAFRPMSEAEFVSWVPHRLGATVIHGWEGKSGLPRVQDMTEAKARVVLRSARLREGLPELRGLNQVRLPVLREGGALELLPAGYDPATGIYTRETVRYAADMDGEEAYRVVYGLLRTFAWSDADRMAVQVAAMLSFFCRCMYVGRAPMFLWNSNLPGSGKSALAQLAIWLVEGTVAAKSFDPFSRDVRPFQQELNSTALSGSNYLFLDDVRKGKVFSNELNAWITQGVRVFRPNHGNYDVSVPVRAITCMTGCQIELGNELGRRTLLVDLFPLLAVEERPLPEGAVELNEEFFRNEERRAELLAAMWALVRVWDEEGRGRCGCGVLPSFEGWAAVVPPMVRRASFGECLARFEQPDAGDTESRELRALVEALVERYCADQKEVWIAARDLVGTARELELFGGALGGVDEKVEELEAMRGWRWEGGEVGVTEEDKRRQAARHLSQKEAGQWNGVLRRNALNGRHFRVAGGTWQFGTRRKTGARGYLLVRVV